MLSRGILLKNSEGAVLDHDYTMTRLFFLLFSTGCFTATGIKGNRKPAVLHQKWHLLPIQLSQRNTTLYKKALCVEEK